jgi:pimeloyl-ACP methyl ester carboxylesterase
MTPGTRSPLRRWSIRVLRLAVVAYIGLCLATYLGQDWLMYPAARKSGEPPRSFRFGPGSERVDLKAADGTPIAAAFGVAAFADGSPRPDAAARPTVLYFYGNGGSVEWSWSEFDAFRRLGANVMIPDLPGYGASGGRPGEAPFYAAADAAYAHLLARPGVDSQKVIVVGWSLGGGIAVDLASRRPVAALVLCNAFTSMPEMAGQLLPWLPGRYLCRAQFLNEAKIRSVRCPTLICNGLRDTLIPATMSDRLAAAAGGPVTRVRVADADHNAIFDPGPEGVWPAIGRLVDEVAAR